MADLVIMGMEMPTEQRIEVLIFKNGFVAYYDVEGRYIGQAKAVPLPEGHGRLIDADALIDALETQDYSCAPDTLEDWTPQDMTVAEIADITHAPTIVPAEGWADNGK